MYEQPKFELVLVEVDVIRTSNSNPDDGEIDWG
jgi:hypothetical protein